MYQIGELAKLNQVKTDTLRYYEKQGLLLPSFRSESGYRIYTKKDAQRLRFIIRAKKVGFTLFEISELLSVELDKTNKACADVKSIVNTKLAHVNEKIEELNYFRTSLQRLSTACCGGPESAEHCSILEALESNSSAVSGQNNGHHRQHVTAKNHSNKA